MPADDYKYTGVKDANSALQEQIIQPSNFETVDYAFYDFINEKMDIRAVTNKGWKKVPIVWSSAERAFFSKENKDLRDLDGTLILPLIGVERTSLSKDLSKKGSHFGGTFNFQDPYHGSRITVARRIVSDKTNNFAVADNRKQFGTGGQVSRTPNRQSYFPRRDKFGKIIPNEKAVYETISIPIPTWVTVNYEITLRTEYQQQINELIRPFITVPGGACIPPVITRLVNIPVPPAFLLPVDVEFKFVQDDPFHDSAALVVPGGPKSPVAAIQAVSLAPPPVVDPLAVLKAVSLLKAVPL